MAREKITSIVLFLIISALLNLSFITLNLWLNSQKMHIYEPPRFQSLMTSEGTLSFTQVLKHTGGYAVLRNDVFRLVFNCGSFIKSDGKCHFKDVNEHEIDIQNQIRYKKAKIWWYKDPLLAGNRLYQLDVEGKTVLQYEELVQRYYMIWQRERKSVANLFEAIVFLMISIGLTVHFFKAVTLEDSSGSTEDALNITTNKN